MTVREKIGVIVVAALGCLLLIRSLTGLAHASDDTFLRIVGHLENKDTGKAVPNAVVMLVGAGLPPQTRADSNGNIGASSSSSAEHIQVVIRVAGYLPHSLVIARRERLSVCGPCMMPVFSLTPIHPPSHAQNR